MKAAYIVRRYTREGVRDTQHATYSGAAGGWRAYEAARIEAQGGVGLSARYRVELIRVRDSRVVGYTAVRPSV
jgi:hypothetical protein